MVSTNDFSTGMAIYVENRLCEILNFEHSRQARGSAFVRTRLRDLRTGDVLEETFQAGEDFEQAYLDEHDAQFLYEDGEFLVFMNMETYDQVELSADLLGERAAFLRENMELELRYCDGEPIGVELPDRVTLEVQDTEPGVRGDTAQGGTKPATAGNGLALDVPLFIEEGEQIVVNTDSGEYVERAEDS